MYSKACDTQDVFVKPGYSRSSSYLSSVVEVLRKPVFLYVTCFGLFKGLFPTLTDDRLDNVNTGKTPNMSG